MTGGAGLILGATTSDSPLVLVGGGTLLAACITFTLALMRQARKQYRDESEARAQLAQEMEQHRRETDVQTAADRARYEALIEAQTRRIERTEERERICNRRVDMLVTACRQGGVDIPEEVWNLG